MRSIRTMAALGAVLALGCRQDTLTPAESGLAIEAAELRFPRTFLGHPTTLPVTVTNTARTAVEFEVKVDGPWRVELARGTLDAAATTTIRVQFAPEKAGIYSGRLELGDVGLKVSGIAEPVPDCDSTACRTSAFDPQSGACVTREAPDGASCDSGCTIGARCAAGECVGGVAGCDDGNACTRDRCDSVLGCVFEDRASTCPAPEDPCQVAYCDPASGCASEAAPDGVACGAAECSGAWRCRAGRCALEPMADGEPCGSPTPCRDAGVCSAGTCERPPPRVLAASWSRPTPGDTTLVFPGLADDDGNVFWAERGGGEASLVSIARNGSDRFRVPMSADWPWGEREEPGRMLLADGLVVSALAFDVLEAFDATTGAPAWRRDLVEVVSGGRLASGDPETKLTIGPAVPDGAGALVARVVASSPDLAIAGYWVVRVSLASGEVLGAQHHEHDVYPLVADEDGSLYVLEDRGASFELSALDAGGLERWRVPTAFFAVAAYGGRLHGYDGFQAAAISTADGRAAFSLPVQTMDSFWRVSPLVAGGAAFALASPCGAECSGFPGGPIGLYGFEPDTGALRWSTPLGDSAATRTPPLLTAAGSVVLATANALREIGPDGEERFACALPPAERFDRHAAIVPGSWITATRTGVHAFAVPGLSAATSGWAAPGGSLARARRPR